MLDWFQKSLSPARPLVHPPWKAGQYATYFLERDNGTWTALALQLLRQADDKTWLLSADFKTRTGESRAWLRYLPTESAEAANPVSLRMDSVRGSPASEVSDPEKLNEHHELQTPLAINLLMVRCWPSAAKALRGRSRKVDYPCAIDEVYPLITPLPPEFGYQKQQDLHPAVMLTGVACLSIDGGKNPLTVTSFGLANPQEAMQAPYDDFIDLSHLIRVDHEGFSLTYPATWFLRSKTTEEPDLRTTKYFGQFGGNTCGGTWSIVFYSGIPDRVRAECDKIVARMENPPQGPEGDLLPRTGEAWGLLAPARGFVFDFVSPAIDGISYNGIFSTDKSLAHVVVFGCIAKANPRRDKTLIEMHRVFREILEGFRLSGEGDPS